MILAALYIILALLLAAFLLHAYSRRRDYRSYGEVKICEGNCSNCVTFNSVTYPGGNVSVIDIPSDYDSGTIEFVFGACLSNNNNMVNLGCPNNTWSMWTCDNPTVSFSCYSDPNCQTPFDLFDYYGYALDPTCAFTDSPYAGISSISVSCAASAGSSTPLITSCLWESTNGTCTGAVIGTELIAFYNPETCTTVPPGCRVGDTTTSSVYVTCENSRVVMYDYTSTSDCSGPFQAREDVTGCQYLGSTDDSDGSLEGIVQNNTPFDTHSSSILSPITKKGRLTFLSTAMGRQATTTQMAVL